MSPLGLSAFAASYVRERTTARMTDACQIWTPGPVTTNHSTGKASRSQSALKYDGPCRFWEVAAGQQALLGDQQVVFSQSFLSVPFDAPVPEADDVVKITSSADADLVGRTVKVISIVRGGGLRASRRFLVQVIDSPEASSW